MSRANRIARLVAIQQGTEFVLLKHQQGKHDQSTHGSWDTDRSNNKSDFKYPVQDAIDKVIKGEVGKVVPADAEFWLDKMADREDNPDLTNLEIVGTQLFTRDNLGIMRDEMPQVPYKRKGEFISEMEKRGIAVTREEVSPQKLHPIQAEISAKKSGKLARDIKKNGHGESDGARIIVSSDDYIIDGHHRWAASAFLSFKDKGQAIPILRVDMTHMELIDATLAWNKATGIESLSLDKSARAIKKAWVEFELAVVKAILKTEMQKHRAGQHDQESHGSWAGETAGELTDDEIRELIYNTDSVEHAFQKIAKRLGKSMKPRVADSFKVAGTPVYRGVQNVTRDAQRLLDGKIRYSDYQTYGQGIYVTEERSIAGNYGTLISMKLDDSAKMLRGEAEWDDSFKFDYENPNARTRGTTSSKFLDLNKIKMKKWAPADIKNLYLASKGYDGVVINSEILLFNADKLTVDEEDIGEAVRKHLAGQHDQKSHGVRGAGLNPEVASDIVRFTQEWGGLSINMVDGSMPKTGYMVAKPPSFGKIVDAVDFSDPVKGPKILSDYMKRHKNDLGNGKNYLGTWLNDGKVYLDVSENIQSKSTATRIGRERNQKAIWDVANLDEIDTGGTGLVEKGSQDGGVEEHLGDDRRGDRRIRAENLGKSSGEEKLTVFVKRPVQKHLAGQHDQSSHGSWSGTTSLGAGSGLSALEISNLKRGAGTEETQQAEVYKAETEARKENQLIGTLEEPRFSSFRVNPYTYTTAEERAFKKAWNKWETEKYKHIESDLGNKHLDGTIRGVRNYANEIFDSEWFREEYGVPSVFESDNGKKFAEHQPEIKTLKSKKFGGMYRFRDYNIHGKRSSIEIRNDSLKYEPTILHEIAHYATAISATNKHSGHGKEFAYNNLKIAKQFMPKYAIALERYYKEMGISYE
jgi:hypothetical protein